MAYARSKFNAEVGNNLLSHDAYPTDLSSKKLRDTNTFKSNITFAPSQVSKN
jgi:hypothetical protein